MPPIIFGMQIKHIVDIVYSKIYGKPKIRKIDAKEEKKAVKKIFISDYEIRKKYYDKNSKTITIPPNSIISPLSMDWIDYENIKIIIKE
ncbi:MAG: hypothetical protein ACP5SD_02385 [Elusimicrobiales bacterium]